MEPQHPIFLGLIKVLGFLAVAFLIAFIPTYFFDLGWFGALAVLGLFYCVKFVHEEGWQDWVLSYWVRNINGYADECERTDKDGKFERGRYRYTRLKSDKFPEKIQRVAIIFQISGWRWRSRRGMIFYNWAMVDYPWKVKWVILPERASVDWNWRDVWRSPGTCISHVHLSRIGEEGTLLVTVEKALEIIMENTMVEAGGIKTTPLYKIAENLYEKKDGQKVETEMGA